MLRHSDLKFDVAIAKRAIWLVAPISLHTIFSLIIFMSDRYYIEQIGTMKDLAIYNLAWTISGIIPFISNSAHNIWLPDLLREKDGGKIWIKAKSMALKLILGFTTIAIGTIFLVKILLVFSIIDHKYDQVVPVLPLVLFAAIILSFFQLTFNYLLTMSKIHVIVMIGFLTAIASVFITKKLVLIWGVYGAAISMVILNLMLLLPSLFFAYHFFKKSTSVHAHRN